MDLLNGLRLYKIRKKLIRLTAVTDMNNNGRTKSLFKEHILRLVKIS
jgi:hypothetical protein